MKLNATNKKIIDAVIKKTKKVCPNSLALIGVYGSVATGETHSKSDLDLLILIADDKGLKLTSQFILNDTQIGYDIYCTRWDDLVNYAQCHHAQLSKLMDSKIVYIKDDAIYKKFCQLREKARKILKSKEILKSAEESFKNAKISYANANLHDQLGLVRMDAFNVINDLLNAVMLYRHTYFKKGVKKTVEELKQQRVGQSFINNMKKISKSKDISEIRAYLRDMILYVEKLIQKRDKKTSSPKKLSSQLTGTYEEMYSNWKNKMQDAATRNDTLSSFMSICPFAEMLKEISSIVDIGKVDILNEYNPDCLTDNVKLYNKYLEKYKQVCKKFKIKVNEFKNVDDFVRDYLHLK